jgi:glycosyltransferase involved in cell wall biosynthesis
LLGCRKGSVEVSTRVRRCSATKKANNIIMSTTTLYDASYLLSRLGCYTPDGFTNVDFAYGRYFSQATESSFVHYGKDKPNVLGRGRAQTIIQLLANARWSQGTKSEGAIFNQLRQAIFDQQGVGGQTQIRGDARAHIAEHLERHHVRLRSIRLRLPSRRVRPIPEGSVYLNVAQYKLEASDTISWLENRLDVRPVFFLHDLLPLDYPEFFPAGEAARFNGRVETAMRYSRGLIFASKAVRDRVEEEFSRRRRSFVPHLVAPLPSPLTSLDEDALRATNWLDDDLAKTPYFVMVSTIEPRKNHLLMVSVWRQLAEQVARNGGVMPKLVIVGRRGHGSQQVFDVLDPPPRGRSLWPFLLQFVALDRQREWVIDAFVLGGLRPANGGGAHAWDARRGHR